MGIAGEAALPKHFARVHQRRIIVEGIISEIHALCARPAQEIDMPGLEQSCLQPAGKYRALGLAF